METYQPDCIIMQRLFLVVCLGIRKKSSAHLRVRKSPNGATAADVRGEGDDKSPQRLTIDYRISQAAFSSAFPFCPCQVTLAVHLEDRLSPRSDPSHFRSPAFLNSAARIGVAFSESRRIPINYCLHERSNRNFVHPSWPTVMLSQNHPAATPRASHYDGSPSPHTRRQIQSSCP